MSGDFKCLISQDFFALFGIEAQFNLALSSLEQTYRQLQNSLHPDRFATHSDSEKRLATQAAVRVNEAWQTLKSPLSRARYLLQLRGIDTEEHSNTAMPTEFLMAQMAWREAIEDAKNAADAAQLEAIGRDIAQEKLELFETLRQHFEGDLLREAALVVRQCQFLQRLEESVGDALESISF